MITHNITPPGMLMFGDFYKVLKYKILTCNLFCNRGCNGYFQKIPLLCFGGDITPIILNSYFMNPIQAVIVSINDVVKTKTNGKSYVTCKVEFPNGKTWFAQRTLGENKAVIHVGQTVTCIPSVIVDAEGKNQPFLEISTGVSVSSKEEILAMLGL